MADGTKSEGLESFSVTNSEAAKRLDAVLCLKMPDISRTRVQAMIEEGLVLLNDKPAKAGHKLVVGDVVSVTLPVAQVKQVLQAADLPLDIVFEDADIVVVNKPVGMVVHPGAGETGPTLAEVLLARVKTLSSVAPDRPGIVHRLDKDTSGLLVCAKTDTAHHHLSKQFEAKTNYRQYCALLDGLMPTPTAVVESMISRDPHNRLRMRSFPATGQHKDQELPVTGRWARSHFTKVHTYGRRLSFVHIQLETGRTHQIRVHAKDIKLPVWGDLVYHRITELPSLFDADLRAALASVSHQLLHAKILGFEHPRTGEKMAFEAPVPPDFAQVLKLLESYSDPVL